MNGTRIKICCGAGCKAWDSEQFVNELNSIAEIQEPLSFEIEIATCMNSCGGGVSLQTLETTLCVYKFRTVNDALDLLSKKGLLDVVKA